jgi:hypothetical protein
MNNNITTEIVYNVLSSSLSQDNTTRSAAEKQLHTWESDSVPGFIGSLLKIAEELQNVSEVSMGIKNCDQLSQFCIYITMLGGSAEFR